MEDPILAAQFDQPVDDPRLAAALRLNDSVYQRLRTLAERDNRRLSNFIETATLRYLEQEEYADESGQSSREK